MKIKIKKFDLIILGGGYGKRLGSITKNIPKPILRIENEKPFLHYLLKNLETKYFNQIFITIHYKYKKILKDIKNTSSLRNLIPIIERKPLGTGGSIKNLLTKIKISDPFYVINGDTFLKIDLLKFNKFFYSKKGNKKFNIITLLRIFNNKRFGSVEFDKKKKVLKFCDNNRVQGYSYINAGFYLFYKDYFRISKENFSLEKDLLPQIIKKRHLYSFVSKQSIFFDIGVPKDFYNFKNFIKLNKYV